MVSVYNACDTFGNIISPLPTPSLLASGEVATFAEALCPYLVLIPGVGALPDTACLIKNDGALACRSVAC